MRSGSPSRGLAILTVLFSLAVAGCSGSPASDTTTLSAQRAGPTTSAPPPALPTLRVGLLTDLTTTNSWAAFDTDSGPSNDLLLLSGAPSLYGLSIPGFEHVPRLASSPAQPSRRRGNGWVAQVQIRSGVTWSDGTAVTASDLAFTFETVRELRMGGRWLGAFPSVVERVEAVDDRNLRIEFSTRPTLGEWQAGVGLAPWKSRAFWEPAVADARAMGEEVRRRLETDPDEARALAADGLSTPESPLSVDDIGDEQLAAFLDGYEAMHARQALYAIDGTGEPSAGGLVFESWERDSRARAVAYVDHYFAGTRFQTFADGSVRLVNPRHGLDETYGDGAGGLIADYTAGPYVGSVDFVIFDDEGDALLALQDDRIDLLLTPLGITERLQARLGSDPDLTFTTSTGDRIRYLAFNLRRPPLGDRALRRALATMVDRNLIESELLPGEVVSTYTMVPEAVHFWHNPEVERGYPGRGLTPRQRLEQAVSTLEAAGWSWDRAPAWDAARGEASPGQGLHTRDGEPLRTLDLLVPGPDQDPTRYAYAEQIVRWAGDLGIEVELTAAELEAIIERVYREEAAPWDMVMLGWNNAVDPALPDLGFFFASANDAALGGANATGYKSLEFDGLVDAWESATTLEAAREVVWQMEGLIARDLPYIVLYDVPKIEVHRGDVVFPDVSLYGGIEYRAADLLTLLRIER